MIRAGDDGRGHIKHPGDKGGSAIAVVVTLREAGRRLKREPDYAKGYAEALGIRLYRVGRAIVMSESDFQRIVRHMKRSAALCAAAS